MGAMTPTLGGMPSGGYFGRALVVDIGDRAATSAPLPLDDAVLRAYLGGVGLGTWLLHRLAPAGIDPLAADAPLAFVFSPLVGTPLTTSAKFAVVAKSPLTGLLTDALASSRFAIAGKLTGNDAIVVRGRAAQLSVLLVDGDGSTTRTCAGAGRSVRGPGRGDPARAIRARLADRGHRARRGAAGPLRHGQPRRPACRPRRAGCGSGSQEPQGRHGPVGHPGRRSRSGGRAGRGEGSAGAQLRPGHREVPRAGHPGQPAGLQRRLHAAHPQLHRGHLRRRSATGRRGAARAARGGPQLVRVVLDRLRAHLLPQGRRPAAHGVRERVRARAAVRGVGPGRRVRRQRPLRRAGARHHLGGRHDRLGDGVRRARADRRAVAALRRRRGVAQRPGPDRRPRGPRRAARPGVPARGRRSSARARSRSRRRSRAWSCPGTSRARCTRWRWAWPSTRAVPTTTAPEPTKPTCPASTTG